MDIGDNDILRKCKGPWSIQPSKRTCSLAHMWKGLRPLWKKTYADLLWKWSEYGLLQVHVAVLFTCELCTQHASGFFLLLSMYFSHETPSELKWNRKRTESSFKWTDNVNAKRTESLFCWSTFWSTLRGLSLVPLETSICENTLSHNESKNICIMAVCLIWLSCVWQPLLPLKKGFVKRAKSAAKLQ